MNSSLYKHPNTIDFFVANSFFAHKILLFFRNTHLFFNILSRKFVISQKFVLSSKKTLDCVIL